MEIGNWVWSNFDDISGISFLPFSEHTYRQAPYQDCTKEEYDSALQLMPSKVDWSQLTTFEEKDFTIGSQELACAAGDGCEVVDL
jgi:ribonucleoside-diphosphate reductase alpha chain